LLLPELLELLFAKFNAVATANSVVLQDSVGTQLTQQEEIKLYDMAEVWVKIQDVLQMLLTEYLDMKNTRTASGPLAHLSFASTRGKFAAFFFFFFFFFCQEETTKAKEFSFQV
jgi:exocyst complex component 4